MMRMIDFSSWEGIVSTIIALLLMTLVGVGVRLLMMMTIQQRREQRNRQINERLRTLIAAYKVLGGSITGDLAVSPLHKRDLAKAEEGSASLVSTERGRRIRDAVETALSDILLLGSDAQVRLAAAAARDLAAGREVRSAELVRSLRDHIRAMLDLAPIPADVDIPEQGPSRPSGGGGGRGGAGRDGDGGGRSGGASGGGAGGGGGGMGMGMGMAMGGSSDAGLDAGSR